MDQNDPEMAQDEPKIGRKTVPRGSKIGLPRPSNIRAEKGSARVNVRYDFGPFLDLSWGPYKAYVGPQELF